MKIEISPNGETLAEFAEKINLLRDKLSYCDADVVGALDIVLIVAQYDAREWSYLHEEGGLTHRCYRDGSKMQVC